MDGAFPSQGDGSYGGGRGGRGFKGTAENSKTKLCTRWMEGDCRFGDRCNFAHGDHELRKLGDGSGDGPGRGGYMGRGGGYGGRGAYGGRGGGRGYGGRGPRDEPYGGGGYGGGPQGYNGGGGYGGPVGGMGYGGMPIPDGMTEENWATHGYPTAGPNGWFMYRVKETNDPYFHNHITNQTTWDRPADWPAGFGGPGM